MNVEERQEFETLGRPATFPRPALLPIQDWTRRTALKCRRALPRIEPLSLCTLVFL